MIQAVDLHKSYKNNKNTYEALKGIDLNINEGEMVAIMGKSGAGKSTLLHLLACLDIPDKGQIFIDGVEVNKLNDYKKSILRNKKIGIVLQDFALIPTFSVFENVMIPLTMSHISRKAKKEKVINALSQVEMDKFAQKRVNQLSGGQKQRVAIARAIVQEPKIILADEPTGSLDSVNAAMIMDIFKKLNNSGKTVVIVTHDKDVAGYCNRIITMNDGKIIEQHSIVALDT